jgi:Tfp pilus assembly protein PilO
MKSARTIERCARLIAALMMVAFAALVSRQIVRPFLEARKELGSLREAVEVLSSAESDVDRLTAEIHRVREEIEESEARLPADPNLDGFLERLGELGKETHIRIEKLTPHGIEQRRLFHELQIEVRVSGPFMAIYDFLTRLEHAGQLSRVDVLRILGPRDQDVCSAEMELALYFAPTETG